MTGARRFYLTMYGVAGGIWMGNGLHDLTIGDTGWGAFRILLGGLFAGLLYGALGALGVEDDKSK